MFRDRLLRISLLFALGCGGGGLDGSDPEPLEPSEGGEERVVEPDQDGDITPIDPNAGSGEAVDVNGGDVGGGSTSE